MTTVNDSSNNTAQSTAPGIVLAAIGVVFGDIGTSPLYTFSEAFGSSAHGMDVTVTNVLGVLSLVVWTLFIVVGLKYVTFIMHADNKGEGGIMALMALAQRATRHHPRTRRLVMFAAILGAALFFGDGVITPSITVLSAIEGLGVAAPSLSGWVVWIAVAVLVLVFRLQKYGTGRVGRVFGPIMCLWFLAIGAIGVYHIVQHPMVLRAFNPWYAVNFFIQHSTAGFVVLGAVVLCVTGAEALYADMGHFGRRSITTAWYFFVMPGVILNYFGQGAMLIHNPEAAANPFFMAVPDWALYPMIGLATIAAVIASQAVIAGCFSIMRQAIQLGFLPRMPIVHTSETEAGQIYLPWINRLLMAMVVITVVGFGSSNALAGAYGIAVTGTMAIDTILFLIVVWRMWKWRPWVVVLMGLFFLTIDLVFFAANTLKIADGGWFPLVLGLAVFTLLITWQRGRELLSRSSKRGGGISLDDFLAGLDIQKPLEVSGTAVFLTTNVHDVPHALLHNLKHNKVLHERNVILTVKALEVPTADTDDRISIQELSHGFSLLTLRFGFMEDQDLPLILRQCEHKGLAFDMMDTTFFVSRGMVDPDSHGMMKWRNRLFAFMMRNAQPATAYLKIPANRLIELGARVTN